MLSLQFQLPPVRAVNGVPVHNLNTNLNYTTIQQAIDAVDTDVGHTILVDAGIYYENVTVNKAISLVGEDRSTTIIDGNRTGTPITITADNVTVTDFTVQNSGDAPEKGIYLDNVDHCNIAENIITNNQFGIRMWNSCNNNTISRNNITGNQAALYLQGFANSITANHVVNNYFGISLYASSSHNIVSDNHLANNGSGISLYSASNNNTISGNNITTHYTGIYIDRSSDNMFYHNNIFDNFNQVTTKTSINMWDNGIEGNYWSNYTGSDTNNNGLGDTPHVIDGSNHDTLPLMGMFTSFLATPMKQVDVVSNSTLSSYQFNGTALSFDVSGANGTIGFIRIRIPIMLMGDTFRVFVNGTEISHITLLIDDPTHSYLYFTYSHSSHEVIVIPEPLTMFTLSLLIMTLLLGAIICQRKHNHSPLFFS
jgi:parallel beta-helix repeat protein